MNKRNILTLITTLCVSLSTLTTPLNTASASDDVQAAELSMCSASDNFLQANVVTINADNVNIQGEYIETTTLSDYSKNILSRVEEYYDVIDELCIGT